MKPVRVAVVSLLAFVLAACGSMNVVSEGGDARLMLKGYDPVAYFTENKPVRGRPDVKAEHGGVTYRFASEEHKREFLAAPERYAPQFGGFCANGMVYAIPLGGEPENFKIIGGKLYVFGGVRSKLYFEMNQERNLTLADGYWQSEVKDSHWRWQSWKRVWWDKVPHYKTNAELAAEYQKRSGRKPG
jgi:YHS domain-containing protein